MGRRFASCLIYLLLLQVVSADNIFYKEEIVTQIQLDVINPCNSAFQNVKPQRTEAFLGKRVRDPTSIIFLEAIYEQLKEECNTLFTKSMDQSFRDLQASQGYHARQKRSLGHIAGFLAKTVVEYAATNLVASIAQWGTQSGTPPSLTKALDNVTKQRLTSTEGIEETRLNEISAISSSSPNHLAETKQFALKVNPLFWAYQLCINEIEAGAANLEAIAHQSRAGKAATQEIGELVNDKSIQSLDPQATELISLRVGFNDEGYTLYITFREPERYLYFPFLILAIIIISLVVFFIWIGAIIGRASPEPSLRSNRHKGSGVHVEGKSAGGVSDCRVSQEMVIERQFSFSGGPLPLGAPNTSQSYHDDESSSPAARQVAQHGSTSTVSVDQDSQLDRVRGGSLRLGSQSSRATFSQRDSTSTVSVVLDDELDDDVFDEPSNAEGLRNERMLAWQRQEDVVTRPRGRSDLSIEREGLKYDCKLDYRTHPYLNFGRMMAVCRYCRALKFQREPAGLCCSEGKVVCQAIDPPPGFLDTLFSYDRPESKKFMEYIRRYNACFSMTSMGVRGFVDETVAPMTFRIQGQVYHRIGSLLPESNVPPTYLQIYFMGDSEVQIDRRTLLFQGVDRNIVAAWQSTLQQHNQLIRSFKTLLERQPRQEQRIVLRSEGIPANQHPGRFHLPTTEQVAVLMVDGEYNQRDIVLNTKDNRLKRIYETHRYYDALQYPIIFWRGQETYHFDLKRVDPATGREVAAKLSSMDLYQYHLMPRTDHRNYLLRCGSLLNQFIVDMWAKIEAERLRFLRMNQSSLRADSYIHLTDAIALDRNPDEIGTRVILPSTFIGSPRHMHEYAQDAMALVGKHGGPDLFITVTCNPNWREIKGNLFSGQTATDRHDVVARVFRQKLLVMLDLIKLHNIFGPVKCWMYSIEWQKRGLPHSHMLFWLSERLRPEQIDSIICAEIPYQRTDPQLFSTVTSFMIHGPCGALHRNAPCMNERGQCTKKYPRAFLSHTVTGDDGYPCYRRRSPNVGGNTFDKNFRGDRLTIDNRWVVPYNPLLSRMLDCHINVEYCTSVKSIKYLFKYVTKGSDLAILELRNRERVGNVPQPNQPEVDESDEITLYQVGRYVSTDEAIWRIYGFLIHDRHPNVVKLQVHLENGQRVQFNAANARSVSERGPPKTTLTAFFDLNRIDSFARTLLYSEVPSYYTWDQTNKSWKPRVMGVRVVGYEHVRKCDTIGRVYGVHPNYHECFHLRLLLNHVKGATSFADIRTVEGRLCQSYRDACLALNLLESDAHWIGALNEAARCRMPRHMRHLLATILCFCGPSNPEDLWQRFKDNLSEDFLNRERRIRNQNVTYNDAIYNSCLIALEDITLNMRNITLPELGLPSPSRARDANFNNEIQRELDYDTNEMQSYYDSNLPLMVDDQREAFNQIVDAIDQNRGGVFFLDAPGGTGKTFLINLILNHVRLNGHIAVATAASGIASTLLFGGRTAHSSFKLPLKPDREPRITLATDSPRAQLLKRSKLIVWDECTMVHKIHFESLDLTLKDLKNNRTIMGGIVVLLSGDFRQTLPVIKRGTPADSINACLKRSVLWRQVVRLTLSTNMRVHLRGDVNAARFSGQLLQIGNGTFPCERNDLIRLSNTLCCPVSNRTELLNKVFPDFTSHLNDKDWLAERALLAPLNETVDDLNSLILSKLPGRERTYLSIDSTSNPEDVVHYPVEVLNALTPAGMPPHRLTLKEGAVIMLIRNFRPPQTCNGTLFFVRKLHNNMIEAETLKGAFKGEIVFIPRFPLDSDELIVKFRRRQFPVRLAFALSVNKSQGQSYKIVGVDLSKPCFSHGQLYVAFSRVGSPSCLFVQTQEGLTRNIVFSRALR